jgi:ELWxxDGT repeat protein
MSTPSHLLASLVLAALLFVPARAGAGGPELLRDIQDAPGGSADSSPRQLTPFRGQIAFLAAVANGPEGLWVSDGTAPGTRTVFQGCDGDCAGLDIVGVVNGFLLFSAGDEEGPSRVRRRLWRTDGTRAGTLPLAADFPPPADREFQPPEPVVVTPDALYFLRCTGGPCAIWQSDGTPAGTAEWKRYGGPGSLSGLTLAGNRLFSHVFESGSDPLRFWAVDRRNGSEALVAAGSPGVQPLATAAGGKLFFLARGADGAELWASDGTPAGTRPLTQFEAGDPFEDTEWLQAIGGRLYFVANDVVHGYELWRSDGTPQGTVRVSDFGFFEALAELEPAGLAEIGGKVLFQANDGLTAVRLWTSDGTPASTAPFRSLCRSEPCGLPQSASRLVRSGAKVFLAGDNGLWSTDGTLAGTVRLAGPPCAGCPPLVFQALRGGVVYSVRSSLLGYDLWISDGTAAGTRRLTAVRDLGLSESPAPTVVAVGPRTYFAARDRHGLELWVAEGRQARLVADLVRAAPGSEVREMTPAGVRLYFTACDARDRAVWVSGGRPETTAEVPGTAGGCSGDFFTPVRLTTAGGRLFYEQRDADRVYQLWSTNGGAPVQLTHLAEEDQFVDAKVAFQGRLLAALRLDGQVALWQSNDAGDGLVKLVDLPGVGSVDSLWAAGGEVYFRAFADDVSLWRTDGTPAGTRQLVDGLLPTSGFVRLGSAVLFAAESRDANGFSDNGLWKTDGTAAGTVPVVRAVAGGFDELTELTLFQLKVYFRLAQGLWRSDGTAAGTVLVRQFTGGPDPSLAPSFGLTFLLDQLYFAADDGIHGRELWASDGTPAGTRLVIDLRPGPASGAPGLATPAAGGGRIYFAGNDGAHGTELWASGGTAAGTRLAWDIAPEGASSQPDGLVVAGAHLYFVADDALNGREPWALPLDNPSGCLPSDTRLCLNDGRYKVEATWRTAQGRSGSGKAVPLSLDTGYFWFFDPANVETVVKVLDGRGLNGHAWVFYGALSNVEYTLTVTDTLTGLTRRYFNPQGTLASVGDTQGFGPLGAHARNPAPPPSTAAAAPPPLISERAGPAADSADRAAAAPCQAGPRTLCLDGNRFAVEVAWKDFQSRTGTGTAVPLTADTGTFWFFDPANVELVVKILDGRGLNGKFWLFYGALSNVEYTLTVTDTATGTIRTYRNPSGRFGSVADIGAF